MERAEAIGSHCSKRLGMGRGFLEPKILEEIQVIPYYKFILFVCQYTFKMSLDILHMLLHEFIFLV